MYIGIGCYNKKQKAGTECEDYEVRYLCPSCKYIFIIYIFQNPVH